MTINVKQLGKITRFNGVDISQMRYYIKISNRTSILKMLSKHPWIQNEPTTTIKILMKSEASYQSLLETQPSTTPAEIANLEEKMGFGYHHAIGELIYALVTCHPDISYAVIKLSQYLTKPSRIHFEALKNIYRYLNQTMDNGIHYWRKHPCMDLQKVPFLSCPQDPSYDDTTIPTCHNHSIDKMFGVVDSEYTGDTLHCRSVTDIALRLASGTIMYKSKFQESIALSSTEAKFIAAAEAGKHILYTRSILEEIGIEQEAATILYEDNQGALLMANTQQPTKQTHHMDIKHFILQQWVENDIIHLRRITTNDNFADALTKANGRINFQQHMSYILGKHPPQYTAQSILTTLLSAGDKSLQTNTGGYHTDIQRSGNNIKPRSQYLTMDCVEVQIARAPPSEKKVQKWVN